MEDLMAPRKSRLRTLRRQEYSKLLAKARPLLEGSNLRAREKSELHEDILLDSTASAFKLLRAEEKNGPPSTLASAPPQPRAKRGMS